MLLDHRAVSIQANQKTVSVADQHDNRRQMDYDKLVIATGAGSAVPDIEGSDLAGVFSLRWMQDSFAMQRYLTEKQPGGKNL